MDADMALRTTPPPEWAQSFNNPSDVPISMSMHPPELAGSTIRIRYPDGQLAAYVANVDARIHAANLYFEQSIHPALNAAEAQAQNNRETAQARVARDSARRRTSRWISERRSRFRPKVVAPKLRSAARCVRGRLHQVPQRRERDRRDRDLAAAHADRRTRPILGMARGSVEVVV